MALSPDLIVRQLVSERSQVLAYIWSIVHDEHIAEDVFQDLFLIASRKADEIEDVEHFRKWIRKAARYQALNASRKKSRAPMVFDAATLDLLDQVWEDDQPESSERSEALRACLEQLSPYARRLVTLRYVDGLSGQSLADALDRKVGTVYTALSRVHRTLGDCIRLRLRGKDE
ncbi:sigma-70 family RNA polymerase sigma factor [Phycisphaeraceae bacterium D3-23]